MTNRTYKVQEFFQLEKILIIFEKSKIIEEVKGLYKYNEEKERFETFTFNDKRIEKSKVKEGDDFTIPKKTKGNNKSNER